MEQGWCFEVGLCGRRPEELLNEGREAVKQYLYRSKFRANETISMLENVSLLFE
jgi:hypothetical protein